jgi:putative hydrolase of the HAD superfamily
VLPQTAAGARLELVQQALLAALHFRAFEDARAALIAARAVAGKVVVVSNWDVSLTHVLEQLELAPLLDGVITSAAAGARKPSAQIFMDALALARVAPEHAVHIGDGLDEDVAGAVGAGLTPVLVRRDGRPGPPGIAVVSSLAEIPFERWSTP